MIIFIISCFKSRNTGRGGHYHSLTSLIKSLNLEHQIIIIGDFFPPALDKEENTTYVKLSLTRLMFLPLQEIHFNKPPKILHAFDLPSEIIGTRLSHFFKIPMIRTKAGGPKERIPYLSTNYKIVFHANDKESIEKRYFNKPLITSLIPQRVFPPEANPSRASPFKKKSNEKNTIKLICITRLNDLYKNKILQSIKLFDYIKCHGIDVELSIVGHIQDTNFYNELKEKSNTLQFNLFTEKEFTENAAELLHFCDFLVGSGRSFLEGLSLGKVCFFPSKNHLLPYLANETTEDKGAAENYTERAKINKSINPSTMIDEFISNWPQNIEGYKKWAAGTFDRKYSIQIAIDSHKKIYDLAKIPEKKYTYIFNSIIFILSHHYRRSLKKARSINNKSP